MEARNSEQPAFAARQRAAQRTASSKCDRSAVVMYAGLGYIPVVSGLNSNDFGAR